MTETQAIGPAIPGNRLLRLTAFLFRGVAYLTFLFTILYAIGFVSGLVVPKTIDTGAESTIGNRALQRALARRGRTGAQTVLHSVTGQQIIADVGFGGVLIVVGPKLSGAGGHYNLVMLCSAPMFAASFLLTKALTRTDRPEVIVVWQGITVSIFSLPLALLHWQALTPPQWLLIMACGLMGSAGHYCLTRSFHIADISATQSIKFLDLVWSAILGWLVFSDVPAQSTLIGGVVICASTLWIARRESRRGVSAAANVDANADGLTETPPRG